MGELGDGRRALDQWCTCTREIRVSGFEHFWGRRSWPGKFLMKLEVVLGETRVLLEVGGNVIFTRGVARVGRDLTRVLSRVGIITVFKL